VTISISTNAQWAAAVPNLVGFWPANSVVVSVVQNRSIIVTARFDLPNDEQFPIMVSQIETLPDGDLMVAIHCDDDHLAYFLGTSLWIAVQEQDRRVGCQIRLTGTLDSPTFRNLADGADFATDHPADPAVDLEFRVTNGSRPDADREHTRAMFKGMDVRIDPTEPSDFDPYDAFAILWKFLDNRDSSLEFPAQVLASIHAGLSNDKSLEYRDALLAWAVADRSQAISRCYRFGLIASTFPDTPARALMLSAAMGCAYAGGQGHLMNHINDEQIECGLEASMSDLLMKCLFAALDPTEWVSTFRHPSVSVPMQPLITRINTALAAA